MSNPTPTTLREILDKHVANYNLEVLGFRQSGQAVVVRQIKEQLKALLPKKRGNIDENGYGWEDLSFNSAIDQIEKAIEEWAK